MSLDGWHKWGYTPMDAFKKRCVSYVFLTVLNSWSRNNVHISVDMWQKWGCAPMDVSNKCCISYVFLTFLNSWSRKCSYSLEVWQKWGCTPMEFSKVWISHQKCDKNEVSHRWSYSKSIEILEGFWWCWKLDFKNVNISWDMWQKWGITPMELSTKGVWLGKCHISGIIKSKVFKHCECFICFLKSPMIGGKAVYEIRKHRYSFFKSTEPLFLRHCSGKNRSGGYSRLRNASQSA